MDCSKAQLLLRDNNVLFCIQGLSSHPLYTCSIRGGGSSNKELSSSAKNTILHSGLCWPLCVAFVTRQPEQVELTQITAIVVWGDERLREEKALH